MKYRNLDLSAEWKLTLVNKSPIHIGGSKEEKSSALIMPLLTSDGAQFVIPGSSIRGVFRSYLYKIAEILELHPLEAMIDGLFGSTEKKGRIWIGDIYLPYQSNLFVKNMTPIGRITQKANDPLTVQSIKRGGKLHVKVVLENPSSHEIGMVALLMRALQEQNLSIGSGETRGLGSVQLTDVETTICQYGQAETIHTKDGMVIPLQMDDWNIADEYISRSFTLTNKDQSLIWMQFAVDSLQGKCKEELPV